MLLQLYRRGTKQLLDSPLTSIAKELMQLIYFLFFKSLKRKEHCLVCPWQHTQKMGHFRFEVHARAVFPFSARGNCLRSGESFQFSSEERRTFKKSLHPIYKSNSDTETIPKNRPQIKAHSPIGWQTHKNQTRPQLFEVGSRKRKGPNLAQREATAP